MTTSDLTRLAERQATGGFTPAASPTRSEQIAEHLIRDEAARPTLAPIVSDMISERLSWPAHGGAPIVLTKAGQPDPGATVAGLIAEIRASFPECFAGPILPKSAASPSAYAPGTLTARAAAEHAARQAGAKPAADAANPYHPSTRNLTRQVLLEKHDPAKAARLRAEAGTSP